MSCQYLPLRRVGFSFLARGIRFGHYETVPTMPESQDNTSLEHIFTEVDINYDATGVHHPKRTRCPQKTQSLTGLYLHLDDALIIDHTSTYTMTSSYTICITRHSTCSSDSFTKQFTFTIFQIIPLPIQSRKYGILTRLLKLLQLTALRITLIFQHAFDC